MNNEDILKSFIDNTKSLFCIFNDALEINFANNAFLEVFGKKKILDFQNLIIRRNNSIVECTGEIDLINRLNDSLLFKYRIFKKNDSYGLILEDISELKEVEKTSNWQRMIIESSGSYICVYDLHRNIIYNNFSLSEYYGSSNILFYSLFSAEYIPLLNEAFLKTSNGVSWKGVTNLCNKQGDSILIDHSMFPIFDDNSKIIAIASKMEDASKRLAQEKLLAEQLRTHKFLSDFSLMFNTFYELDDLMGKALEQLQDFLHPDKIAIYMKEDDIIKCRYEIINNEKFKKTKGNCFEIEEIQELYDQIISVPYLFEANNTLRYKQFPKLNFGAKSTLYIPLMVEGKCIGIMLYICINDYASWSIQDCHIATITSSVIAGAIAMNEAKEKLIKLKDEALLANSAKSQFLSSMSHEIRTPMNALMSMIDIALLSDDIGRIKKCLSTAKNSSDHLLSIINDILDISKIESGKMELVLEEFDFQEVIHSVMEMISISSIKKRQELIINYDNKIPRYLIGDATRFSQVLMNILSNAVKFSEDNTNIYIDFTLVGINKNDVSLKISVKDQGIGMTEEHIKSVFKPFTQADSNISVKFGGTGLGLAISNKITKLMNGNIEVISKLNEGSTFIINIIMQNGTLNKDEVNDLNIDFNILIIDNNIDDMLQMCLEFDKRKIKYDTAKDIYEGIKLIEKNDYKAIFLDYLFDDIDGLEAAKIISDNTSKELNIVLISACNEEFIFCLNSREHIKYFLPKPFFSNELTLLLNQIVGNEVYKDIIYNNEEIPLIDKSILLVEDIEINREIIKIFLEDTGARIIEAENGLTALNTYKDNPEAFDLIIMDLQMPIMGGLEATKHILNVKRKDKKIIPILAMTANAFKEDEEACFNAGMVEHIKKPVDSKELMAKILKHVK